MKKTLATLSFVGATLLSGTTFAENNQFMLDTQAGASNVAVIGSVQKHHTAADSADVTFVKTDFTMVNETEAGHNPSGYWKSKSHQEKIAGALMSDMTKGVIVDSDGLVTIKRTEKGLFGALLCPPPKP